MSHPAVREVWKGIREDRVQVPTGGLNWRHAGGRLELLSGLVLPEMASVRCGCTLSFLQNDSISHHVTPFILINVRTKARPPARSTHQSGSGYFQNRFRDSRLRKKVLLRLSPESPGSKMILCFPHVSMTIKEKKKNR